MDYITRPFVLWLLLDFSSNEESWLEMEGREKSEIKVFIFLSPSYFNALTKDFLYPSIKSYSSR